MACVTELQAYLAIQVVSACYLNVLVVVVQQRDLDTDGLTYLLTLM